MVGEGALRDERHQQTRSGAGCVNRTTGLTVIRTMDLVKSQLGGFMGQLLRPEPRVGDSESAAYVR